MPSLAENALIVLIIGLAVGYLVRQLILLFGKQKTTGCGHGCGTCKTAEPQPKLVHIAPLNSTSQQRS